VFDFHLENAQHDIIGNGVFVPGLFQQAVIGFNRTLFAFDVLFKYLYHVGIIWRIVPAVGEFIPVLWLCYRCPPQLDNACRQEDGMPEFLGRMERQLGDNCFFVGSPDDF